MTQLSPQAQAVLDATWKEMDYAPSRHVRAAAGAVLRAAAQTLAYEVHCPGEGWYELVIDAKDLYAIAAELEDSND